MYNEIVKKIENIIEHNIKSINTIIDFIEKSIEEQPEEIIIDVVNNSFNQLFNLFDIKEIDFIYENLSLFSKEQKNFIKKWNEKRKDGDYLKLTLEQELNRSHP